MERTHCVLAPITYGARLHGLNMLHESQDAFATAVVWFRWREQPCAGGSGPGAASTPLCNGRIVALVLGARNALQQTCQHRVPSFRFGRQRACVTQPHPHAPVMVRWRGVTCVRGVAGCPSGVPLSSIATSTARETWLVCEREVATAQTHSRFLERCLAIFRAYNYLVTVIHWTPTSRFSNKISNHQNQDSRLNHTRPSRSFLFYPNQPVCSALL